jgi:hypothetical protein
MQKTIWNYLKADSFFADFLPHIKSHKFKIRGFNSRNNPIDFSKEEMKEINTAIKKLPPVRKKRSGNNGG